MKFPVGKAARRQYVRYRDRFLPERERAVCRASVMVVRPHPDCGAFGWVEREAREWDALGRARPASLVSRAGDRDDGDRPLAGKLGLRWRVDRL